jgi:secreted PhoX family phosphatase
VGYEWFPDTTTFGCMNEDPNSGQVSRNMSQGQVTRRAVLKWSGAAGTLAVAAVFTQACAAPGASSPDADANGVILLPGFSSRVIARAGENVQGSALNFRSFPDGAATFVDPAVAGGWYLVVNHEVPAIGGVTSIRFAADGTVAGAESILSDTALNCAGGATPWGTWLSCEEWEGGSVWECDPTGVNRARRRGAMGVFKHEAAAVAADGRVYMTEDRPDGAFYRFTPRTEGELSSGLLEVATASPSAGTVQWVRVPNPQPDVFQKPCRKQVPGTIEFNGGEGVATNGDTVWFTTKGDNRIWEFEIATGLIAVRYQAGGSSILSGVDNLWLDQASGSLLIAEDGGDMEVVMLRPDNTAVSVIRLPGQDGSEVTGPCFSPDGQRLYFSSQRAAVGKLGLPLGVTYEVTGPFDDLLAR